MRSIYPVLLASVTTAALGVACTVEDNGDSSTAPIQAAGSLAVNGNEILVDTFPPATLTRMVGGTGACGDGTWAVLAGGSIGVRLWFDGEVLEGSTAVIPGGAPVGGGTFMWIDESDPGVEYYVSGVATLSEWSSDRLYVTVDGSEVVRLRLGEGVPEVVDGTEWLVALEIVDSKGNVEALGPTEAGLCASPYTMGLPADGDWCWGPVESEVLSCTCFVDESGELQAEVVESADPSCVISAEGTGE